MNGASISFVNAMECIGELDARRIPVAESSSMSLIPLQNEPNESQSLPSGVLVSAGSIALKLLVRLDSMAMPWSVQRYAGSAGSSVGFDANPMAEVFWPNFETE